jgi:sulfide:quinone oxidoreductase
VRWSLPAYELALLTAAWLHGAQTKVVLVTAEAAPLEIFGAEAGDAVGGLLRDGGVEVFEGAEAHVMSDSSFLVMPGGHWCFADRIVALPFVLGPYIPGVPHDGHGFLPVDAHGRVAGVEHVYAAGDGTSFDIKQGGLAAQQADAVAEHIATLVDAHFAPTAFDPVLCGLIRAGSEPLYLRRRLGGGQGTTVSHEPLWDPPAKVASRWLSSYLAERERILT